MTNYQKFLPSRLNMGLILCVIGVVLVAWWSSAVGSMKSQAQITTYRHTGSAQPINSGSYNATSANPSVGQGNGQTSNPNQVVVPPSSDTSLPAGSSPSCPKYVEGPQNYPYCGCYGAGSGVHPEIMCANPN